MKMKKSYFQNGLENLIIRQISQLHYEKVEIDKKIHKLEEMKENIDELIKNADLLFGNDPIDESNKFAIIIKDSFGKETGQQDYYFTEKDE